jgi:hypothetical protein
MNLPINQRKNCCGFCRTGASIRDSGGTHPEAGRGYRVLRASNVLPFLVELKRHLCEGQFTLAPQIDMQDHKPIGVFQSSPRTLSRCSRAASPCQLRQQPPALSGVQPSNAWCTRSTGSARCSVTITGSLSLRVKTCGLWLNRVVQDGLIPLCCVGQSASQDPSEHLTRRDRASYPQPRLESLKAGAPAAILNSDFAGYLGNRAAALGA